MNPLMKELSGPRFVVAVNDSDSGLRAFIVIDDTTLGPAAGGIRTQPYPTEEEALADGRRLAAAMTLKCALAGLPAGGAKAVVMDHPDFKREAGFRALGRIVQDLKGLFRTAGDLGTTGSDLRVMAEETEYVHPDEENLATDAARGIRYCMEGALKRQDLRGVRVLVQGVGAMGAALVKELTGIGAEVTVCDRDPKRIEALQGVSSVPVEEAMSTPTEVFAPCAAGGVITEDVSRSLPAELICGAANNVLATPEAGRILHRRSVPLVPDVVASAGAVISGLSRSLMGWDDADPLLRRLGKTTDEILAESRDSNRPPEEIALQRARRILAAARR